MAQIAIKGHPTRDKEVIEILEMLGGKNDFNLIGDASDLYYYINNDNKITYTLCNINSNFKIFTIEEFFEIHPYKIGDVVMLKGDIADGNRFTINKMFWNGVTIKYDGASIDSPRNFYLFPASRLLPCKKETEETFGESIEKTINECLFGGNEESMEGVYAYNEINCYHQDFGDKVRIRLGNDFEIKVEGDITYIVKKQPQYPKTYEECCRAVIANPHVRLTYDNGEKYAHDADNLRLYDNIRKLLICRDAYWKIIGEQMGLGKPWEPNWSLQDYKYVIVNKAGVIQMQHVSHYSRLLAFPTEEIRDMFYENFKEMIEMCKDFL